MNFNIKNTNTELHHIMRLALDSCIFHFENVEINSNIIVLSNTETQTKLTIILDGVSNFEAKIKSKYFCTKKINNYKDYINFISLNNFAIKNNYILN